MSWMIIFPFHDHCKLNIKCYCLAQKNIYLQNICTLRQIWSSETCLYPIFHSESKEFFHWIEDESPNNGKTGRTHTYKRSHIGVKNIRDCTGICLWKQLLSHRSSHHWCKYKKNSQENNSSSICWLPFQKTMY